MVRTARERVDDLFGLANLEGTRGGYLLADRYVRLARRVGTRHNVRIPREYRELYCRKCSAFWAEGRTVRTRLRGPHRIRTCLVCGATRRQSYRGSFRSASSIDVTPRWTKGPEEVLAEEPSDLDEEAADLASEEDE
ncbi:MAG TPA: ribonuclease P [Thermoplasmata archaeon]|nr:ribonuclease P [Thermoplasmata archaeon]